MSIIFNQASSGEYELADVVQSYERRLQQQVTMAKFDIIAALEHQIQVSASILKFEHHGTFIYSFSSFMAIF